MIKDFQKKYGLTPDGVVGHHTANKIKDIFCGRNRLWAANFLGQCAHESGGWKYYEENLNYSAEALMNIFGSHFKNLAEAKEYDRTPEKIANRVYANRMGNGDEASGDGWNYKGRGAIQLTGKANYEDFGNKIKDLSIIDNADKVYEDYYLESAKWYFDKRNIWQYCNHTDTRSIKQITRLINGGLNGLNDRIILTNKYLEIL